MTGRGSLLAAILVYITLDLSLAAMPGAFVFDPGDSVDGTQGRARDATEVVVLPLVIVESVADAARAAERRTPPVAPGETTDRRASASRRLARAMLDAAPPSEDPH